MFEPLNAFMSKSNESFAVAPIAAPAPAAARPATATAAAPVGAKPWVRASLSNEKSKSFSAAKGESEKSVASREPVG